MARVSLIEAADAPAEVKEIYEGKLTANRAIPAEGTRLPSGRPQQLPGVLCQHRAFARPQALRKRSLRISLINGCYYCTQHHIQGANAQRTTLDEMKALKDGNYSAFDERLRARCGMRKN